MLKVLSVSSVQTGCMIETPLGVLRVSEMCSDMELREKQGRFRRGTARPSLTTLCMGFADLGKELHAPFVPGRQNLVTSAQLCVLAARAYGLLILDGVHLGERWHTNLHTAAIRVYGHAPTNYLIGAWNC